jgi:hypothetical protein
MRARESNRIHLIVTSHAKVSGFSFKYKTLKYKCNMTGFVFRKDYTKYSRVLEIPSVKSSGGHCSNSIEKC